MKDLKMYLLIGMIGSGLLFTGCGDDDVPGAENEEEVINEVTLTFTPEGGGNDVIATYVDADGEGVGSPVISDISLSVNTTYTLTVMFMNTINNPSENITEEVAEEGEEHQIFYSWSNNIFTTPTGNGNIDAADGMVNYLDEDTAGNPIGLSTSWTTAATASTDGTFRIMLKHQPSIKSASTTSNDGETDIDISWTIHVQ